MISFRPHVAWRTIGVHRSWGDGCDAWELMATPELAVVADAMPPGTSETAHHHQRASQFFYVLSGELTVKFDGASVTAQAGQGVSVPAGVAHKAMNSGTQPVEFLAIAGPSNDRDRMNETSVPLEAPTPPIGSE